MRVPQHFASSALSSGRAAPREHAVGLHYLHTFSGQRSPAGGFHRVLLPLHSSQVGEPRVHMQPSGFPKQHAAVHTGSFSRWGAPLYTHFDAFVFLLDLAPGRVAGGAAAPCRLARKPGRSSCRHPHAGEMYTVAPTGSSSLGLLSSQRVLLTPNLL